MRLAQTLLNLAFSITPRKNRVWLEDMRYEAAFIENPLPWSLAALGLALRWRLAHVLATPAQMAFASVAIATIAAVLILPNMLRNPSPVSTSALPAPVPNQEATADTYIDPSISRSAEAQIVPTETETASPYSEPLAPTLPSPAITEAIPPTLPATTVEEAVNTPQSDERGSLQEVVGVAATLAQDNTEETLELADAEITSSASASTEESDTDAIEAIIEAAVQQKPNSEETLEVNTSSIKLTITKEVTLEIYQGTSTLDDLVFSGTSSAATLNYDLPIFIKASDGSAIEVYLSEDSSITLEDGEISKIIKLAQ